MAKGLSRRQKIGRLTILSGRKEDETAAPRWEPYRVAANRVENYLDLDLDVRVYQSLWWDEHRLTEFVLSLQVKNGSKWSEVVKVDCSHGTVHAHFYTQKGVETKKTLHEIFTQDDLELGCAKADNLIFKQGDTHVRRWKRG